MKGGQICVSSGSGQSFTNKASTNFARDIMAAADILE